MGEHTRSGESGTQSRFVRRDVYPVGQTAYYEGSGQSLGYVVYKAVDKSDTVGCGMACANNGYRPMEIQVTVS